MKTIKQIITVVALATLMLGSINGNSQTSFNDYNLSLDTNHSLNQSNSIINENNSKNCIIFQSETSGGVVAAADALGAISAVGTVASVASWLSWTPAVIVATIAVVAAAVIGGVSSSIIAANSTGITPNNPKDIIFENISNPINRFDKAGELHNQILYDYYILHKQYSPKSYFDFIQKNKSKYGIKENPITLNFLENQFKTSRKINYNLEEINNLIIERLPKETNKAKYKAFLNSISKNEKTKDKISFIKNFESTELTNDKYSVRTIEVLANFFSTYKYSLALWN